MERFGYGYVHDALRGDKVHRLENILTLDATLHLAFRSMLIWLERSEDEVSNASPAVQPFREGVDSTDELVYALSPSTACQLLPRGGLTPAVVP